MQILVQVPVLNYLEPCTQKWDCRLCCNSLVNCFPRWPTSTVTVHITCFFLCVCVCVCVLILSSLVSVTCGLWVWSLSLEGPGILAWVLHSPRKVFRPGPIYCPKQRPPSTPGSCTHCFLSSPLWHLVPGSHWVRGCTCQKDLLMDAGVPRALSLEGHPEPSVSSSGYPGPMSLSQGPGVTWRPGGDVSKVLPQLQPQGLQKLGAPGPPPHGQASMH
jgi:hypothetical protein